MHAFASIARLHGGVDLLQSVKITSTTLSTSLVLLNQTDGRCDLEIESEWVVSNLFDGLGRIETLGQDVVDLELFFSHSHNMLLWTIILGLLLSFLALLLLATLLTLLSLATTVNLFLEDDVDRDVIILLEVARHWDLDHRWVILQIEEETVKMDVDGAGTEVVEDQEFLDLANAANRALEYLLDEDALLRVHNLIIALLELAVDLDVLDVENGVVRESFLESPQVTILLTEKKKERLANEIHEIIIYEVQIQTIYTRPTRHF